MSAPRFAPYARAIAFAVALGLTGPEAAWAGTPVAQPTCAGCAKPYNQPWEISASSGGYWTGYVRDSLRLLTAPTRFTEEDWGQAMLLAGGTAALLVVDDDIRDWVQRHRTGTSNDVADALEPLAKPYVLLPALAGAYLAASAADDDRASQATLLAGEAAVIAGGIVGAGKLLLHRKRPDEASSAHSFGGPALSTDNVSMPSADTALAFATASVFAHSYPDDWKVAVGGYGLATLIGLERIHNNRHFASDVLLGGAIGFVVGRYVTEVHPFLAKNQMTIVPIAGEGAVGLDVALKF